jgi:hypothetical protein
MTFTHRIEIYTPTLVIAGAYDLALYRRASDAINGEQRRYLPLRDAALAPIGRALPAPAIPSLLVDRREALLVATIAEADPPPDYPREEQVRGVVPVTAMFFTAAFAVRGVFHRRPNLALIEALERATDDFLPLRNVQIYALNGGFAPLARDFAALARERIVALYQVADASALADAPAAPAPPPTTADAPAA